MIIIPDVHGRSFWKEAIKQRKNNETIVFLGDYLDNYPGEIDVYTNQVITNATALDGFKEIINFAKSNEKVYLLLGNHDVEYFLPDCEPCRQDVWNKKEIENLFLDNLNLFSITYYVHSGKTYMFSHAGICPEFIKTIFPDEDILNIGNTLNQRLKEEDLSYLGYILGRIGPQRGGWCSGGSPVWADQSELWEYEGDVYQIVGHSQYNSIVPWESEPVFMIDKYAACLDCRTAFRLNLSDRSITPITSVVNVKYGNS